MPAVLNAANEEAVKAFIDERISLTDIPTVIQRVMENHSSEPALTLETVLNADHSARLSANVEIELMSSKDLVVGRPV